MSKMQKAGNEKVTPQSSRALRDLIGLGVVTIFVLILSYFFNMFALIVKFLRDNPDKVVYADEIITGLLTLSVGLSIFAWRRWLELKKETGQRIKNQEELLRMTETQAETERIISKQLHLDMDQMKEDVREILQILLNKHKKTI
ncbi:MAG: hypothetical protein PHT50_06555 [Candidatus Omnitrophica bacterium]|nr:hypothetical protein [Candidatus Omnitrophota bacterium]